MGYWPVLCSGLISLRVIRITVAALMTRHSPDQAMRVVASSNQQETDMDTRKVEMRALLDDELDIVAGGTDPLTTMVNIGLGIANVISTVVEKEMAAATYGGYQ